MPPTATDCIPFIYGTIQVAKLPILLFVTPQEAKALHAARQRYTLLVKLSAAADKDGTNCRPGDKKLAAAMGVSERQVRRLRADLVELGFVHDDGYVRNPKNPERTMRKWKLMLPPAAQEALGITPVATGQMGDRTNRKSRAKSTAYEHFGPTTCIT